MNQPSDFTMQENEPRLVRLLDSVTYFFYSLSGFLLLLIMLSYVAEIILRFFFNSPTTWSIDTISYLLGAMISLAAPELARASQHVSITLVPETIKRPETRKNYIRVLSIISLLIVMVVVYITGMEVKRLIQNNILTVGTFVIPKWWVSIFIPLGLLFTSLQFLRIGIYGPPAKQSVEPQGSD
jgi:TRAP-type C4-dicarboxylate transport system permease small subunit